MNILKFFSPLVKGFAAPANRANEIHSAISQQPSYTYEDILNDQALDLYEKEQLISNLYYATLGNVDKTDSDDVLHQAYKDALDILYFPYVDIASITNASDLLYASRDIILNKLSGANSHRMAQLQLLSVSLLILSIVKQTSIEALLQDKSVTTRLLYDRQRGDFTQRLANSPLYVYEGGGVIRMVRSAEQGKRMFIDGLFGCSRQQLELLMAKGFAVSDKFLNKGA